MATPATPSTVTAAAPAREFIANINTANEEIVRLDGAVAEATKRAEKAENELKAANDLLAEAPKPADLQAAKDAQKKAEEALSTANDTHAKAVKELQGKVDSATTNGVKAAAAAGVDPVKDVATTGIDHADNKKTNGLTGLARAIAANQELQASKQAK
jgi:hypothetical protein